MCLYVYVFKFLWIVQPLQACSYFFQRPSFHFHILKANAFLKLYFKIVTVANFIVVTKHGLDLNNK